jgi:predicted nucleic acid-binding Zn ribbon protein
VFPEWAAIVGPQIAKVTEPLSVTPQGTLFVAVQSNAWMMELKLLEPELLKKLNVKTGKLSIKKIRLQIQRK